MHPLIEPRPDAPEGEVRTLSHYPANLFAPPCAVLCRNTAPLVAFAYGLLTRSVPCRIIGKDLGLQLIQVVKRLAGSQPITLDEFLSLLDTWGEKEVLKAYNEDRSPEKIYDQVEALKVFVTMIHNESH